MVTHRGLAQFSFIVAWNNCH